MRSVLLSMSGCLAAILGCSSNQSSKDSAPIPLLSTPREYTGVYTSTPDEDYFTPCGIDGVGDSWSLRFKSDERVAPFLKKITATRGYPPLTHFIRIRGRLSAPGSYNLGFQARELAVDSVLTVSETLAPCVGYGVPAAWSGVPTGLRNIRGIALSADHSLVAVLNSERQIIIRSTSRGEIIKQFSSLDKFGVTSSNGSPMVFSEDGQLLAIGGRDGIVRIWKPTEGKGVLTLVLKDSVDIMRERAANPPPPNVFLPPPRNSDAAATDIVFNKSATMLATTNGFSTIIWSTKTGKRLTEFNRGNDFFRKILFVGDEGTLMTADSGKISVRSQLGAAPVMVPGTRAKATEHVALSPDERWLAVNGWGDSVFLWSVAQRAPGPVLPVPGFVTGAIAFSPDGNKIATAGGSEGLYVWDTRTGAPIISFHNFPDPISRAWFSPDGKSIITLSTFDDRLRIVYIDSAVRAAAHRKIFDDSLTAQLPLGPRPSTSPRTVSGIVSANKRSVPGADVSIMNGDAPDSVVARTTTSSGGYFSFAGIRFRHVMIRVRKDRFEEAIKYIHLNRWEEDGPWGIELTPATGGGVGDAPAGN